MIFRLITFTQKHSLAVILAAGLISLLLGAFALNIEFDPEVKDLIPEGTKVTELIEKYGSPETQSEYLMIAVESEELFSLEKLEAFDRAIGRIEKLAHVRKSINPFNLVTFQKQGQKLELVSMAPAGRAPTTEHELASFKQRILSDLHARNLVISGDLTTLGALFFIDEIEDYTEMLSSVNLIVSDLEAYFTPHISSLMLFEHVAKRYLVKDTPRFIILALVVILVIFYFGFRKKRAVILPLIVIVLGTIWTIGVMSLFGFRLTFLSIMTPPLVLTLGSSYSIHVLNQYYREADISATDNSWIAAAMVHINKTISAAALTTAIGFGSLISATIPRMREFGIATGLGILFCAVLSLFFLPAVLSKLSPPTGRQQVRVLKGFLARFMTGLGRRVIGWRFIVVVFLIIVAGLFVISLQHLRFETDYTSFFRRKEKAVEDNLFIAKKFGTFIYVYISLTAPGNEKNYFLNREVLERVSQFEENLKNNPDISYLSSFTSYLKAMNETMKGTYEVPSRKAMILLMARYLKLLSSTGRGSSTAGMFVNEDFSRLTINLRVYDSKRQTFTFEDNLKRLVRWIESEMDESLDPETNPEIWGPTFAMLTVSDTLTRDLVLSALVSFLLIFGVVAVAFRAVEFGLLALVPMATGIMLNFIVMSAFNIPLDVVTVMVSCIAIGVGVDDSIHLLIQYRRQERFYQNGMEKILAQTLKFSGRPILVTSSALIAGLLVLTFSSFKPVVYFGLLVSLAIFTTTLGALIILPALLAFKGTRSRAGSRT